MDPDQALIDLREEILAYRAGESMDNERLVNALEALDRWLCKGGFLPYEWERHRA